METEARSEWGRRGSVLASALFLLAGVGFIRSGSALGGAGTLEAIRTLPGKAWLAATAFVVLQNVIQASRLWAILPDATQLLWMQVLRSFSFGQLVNSYIPARVGDLVKIALLRRRARRDPAVARQAPTPSVASLATSVLVADRISDAASMMVALMVFAPGRVPEISLPRTASPASEIALVALVALPCALVLAAYVAARSSRVRRSFRRAIHGFSGLLQPTSVVLALAFGMAAWASEMAVLMTLSSAFGFPLLPRQALGVLIMLNLAIAIPVSFANIGTYEAAAAFGLNRMGVPTADAVAIATVHHLVQLAGILALDAGLWFVTTFEREPTAVRVRESDKRRIVEYFERASSDYSDRVARGPLRWLRARERQAVLDFAQFADRSKRTMIDVGCGGGFFARSANEAGLRVSAVDITPGMIERIHGHVAEASVGDVETLSTDATYDIVVCAGVLDFVMQPEAAFKNLADLSASGGRLVVQAPREGFGGWIYRLERRAHGLAVNQFSLGWFEAEAQKHGMHVVRCSHPLPWNRVILFVRGPASRGSIGGSAR